MIVGDVEQTLSIRAEGQSGLVSAGIRIGTGSPGDRAGIRIEQCGPTSPTGGCNEAPIRALGQCIDLSFKRKTERPKSRLSWPGKRVAEAIQLPVFAAHADRGKDGCNTRQVFFHCGNQLI